MEFYKQYPSGLRVIARRTDGIYSVSFGIFVDVGSQNEDAEHNGYSHFIEHLLFKGTEKRSALKISEEMDDIGATINAFTSKEMTCFYTKSVSSDLEKCVDVLSDMYLNAAFPEDELEKEKGVVLEEIKMCNDTPDDVCQDLISAALFKGQTLGQTILGNPTNIEYSDRHSIQNYKNLHYIPSKTVISVAGCFDIDQLDKLIERYFESQFSQCETVKTEYQPVVYTSEFLHCFKPIEQAHLEIAMGGVPVMDERSYAISALSGILGGGMSSRLFQSIREKHGLAYSVYAYPSYYSNCGSFEIYAALSPKNIKKVCDILSDEIDLLLAKGITEKEFLRAKTQAINGLCMGMENTHTQMRMMGRRLLKCNVVFDVDEEIAKYKQLTAEQINDAAKYLFTQSFASAYVGKEVSDYNLISKVCKK